MCSQEALFAQTDTPVGMIPVSYGRAADRNTAEILDGYLETQLSKLSNVDLVNRKLLKETQKERDIQKGMDFVKTETIQQGKSIGAQKLVFGHVHETKEEQIKGKEDRQITIRMTVGVINVETGKTEKSEMFLFTGVPDAAKAEEVGKVSGKGSAGGGILRTASFLSGNAELTSHMSAALGSFDKKLKPFLLDAFGGEFLEEPKKRSSENSVITLPNPFASKKDLTRKFAIVGQESENLLKIKASKEDNIKKGNRFQLVTEVEVRMTDWNGNEEIGVEQKVLAEFKFKEYRGDFILLELDKKSDMSIDDIKKTREKGSEMYIIFKQ